MGLLLSKVHGYGITEKKRPSNQALISNIDRRKNIHVHARDLTIPMAVKWLLHL